MLKKRRLLPFLTIFLFSIPAIAFCQGYGVSWNIFTCGGGIRESAHYKLADAIGQVEAKKSSSQNYNVVLGSYLPAPLESAKDDTTPNIPLNSLIPVNNLFHPLKGECTAIKYSLENATHVRLKIYNLAGELINTLVDEDKPADITHEIKWCGKNKDENFVASGVYILRIEAGGFTDTKKMVVIK